jgi:hypothetical protein
MAINFPSSPSINDEFIVAVKAWSWTGSVWKRADMRYLMMFFRLEI